MEKWSVNIYTNYSKIDKWPSYYFDLNNRTFIHDTDTSIEYNKNSNDNIVDDNIDTNSEKDINNYWALLALVLVVGTAAGNILVCLAIAWERRLQNVTNYFLMSLAITDLMVAILVMPLGILTLVKGKCVIIIEFYTYKDKPTHINIIVFNKSY